MPSPLNSTTAPPRARARSATRAPCARSPSRRRPRRTLLGVGRVPAQVDEEHRHLTLARLERRGRSRAARRSRRERSAAGWPASRAPARAPRRRRGGAESAPFALDTAVSSASSVGMYTSPERLRPRQVNETSASPRRVGITTSAPSVASAARSNGSSVSVAATSGATRDSSVFTSGAIRTRTRAARAATAREDRRERRVLARVHDDRLGTQERVEPLADQKRQLRRGATLAELRDELRESGLDRDAIREHAPVEPRPQPALALHDDQREAERERPLTRGGRDAERGARRFRCARKHLHGDTEQDHTDDRIRRRRADQRIDVEKR